MHARTRRAIGTAVVLSLVPTLGLVVVPGAAAAATGPAITVTTPGNGNGAGVSQGGTPVDVQVTVASPPPTDAFVRVVFDNGYSWEPGRVDLAVADAQGNPLAVGPGPLAGSEAVELGSADSGPVAAGTTTLQLSVAGPMALGFEVSAQLVDAATGTVLAQGGGGLQTHLQVFEVQPVANDGCLTPSGSWATWSDSAPESIPSDSGYPVSECYIAYQNTTTTAFPAARLTYTIGARSLTSAGYTAAEFAKLVQLRSHYTASGSPSTPWQADPWVVNADGSLTLSVPSFTIQPNQSNDSVTFTASAGYTLLHRGTVDGTFTTYAADGTVLATSDQALRVTPTIPPHDFTGDGKADLYVMDSKGNTWLMPGTGNATHPFAPMTAHGSLLSTFGMFTAVGPSDIPDQQPGTMVFAINRATGELVEPVSNESPHNLYAWYIESGNWRWVTALVGSASLTGDGRGDLLARDSHGNLWLYPVVGLPGPHALGKAVKLPGNWNWATALIGPGDLTGDGRPDLLARDRHGNLWLYPGTGNPAHPFGNAFKVPGNWNWATALIGSGDLTGDGRPDLLARDGHGNLWLYPGTGNPAHPFGNAFKAPGNWNWITALI
ncbi:VCBS repeat-containing protein [Streptacidiphilus sp. PB12-B1b]|uniref:FG-GAP repeat domain-containing protein n=1 Tax=Streptacidiphilus sp. PB12-B1b TaxID=2705012 RepID=UPI0015F8285D|nr:VCBS repeat-containing protein [Streptacidiphilus sp. PB12-B1b]QMU78241.1 VCBS repeat-containing protein [Streptacidiphilus sp. PB12-B1b]